MVLKGVLMLTGHFPEEVTVRLGRHFSGVEPALPILSRNMSAPKEQGTRPQVMGEGPGDLTL